jgi:hypothetical protein
MDVKPKAEQPAPAPSDDARAAAYLARLKDLVGLKDWQVELAPGPPDDDDALASVRCVHGRKIAIVHLSRAFFDQDPAERRHAFVHELIHCHHAHADSFLEDVMSARDFQAWSMAMEYAIDGVASVLAPHLPLPE